MYRRVHPARTRHGGVRPPLRSLGCRPRPKPVDGGAKRALDLAHGGFVLVLLARPEKSLQPVLLAARNDVDVEVRHALTDAVVDGDKRSLGSERDLCGASQEVSRASADSAHSVLSGPDGGPLAFRTAAADRPRGAAARGIVERSRTVRV